MTSQKVSQNNGGIQNRSADHNVINQSFREILFHIISLLTSYLLILFKILPS